MQRWAGVFVMRFAPLLLLGTTGCGGSEQFDVVPIRGKVTCEGQPVTAGQVQFVPTAEGAGGAAGAQGQGAIVGRSATGSIQKDGTFMLSTYSQGDGAVVGRHRIVILPAVAGASTEEEEEVKDNDKFQEEVVPLPCQPPSELFVEVTSETSVVDIEMGQGGSVTTQ